MAAASSTCMHLLLDNRRSALRNPWKCSVRYRSSFCSFGSGRINKASTRDLVSVYSTPVTAGDALSSLVQPGVQAFSDSPWLSLIAALFVTVPLIQKLLALTKQVDTAAQTVIKMGNTVEKVAKDVDRAKENISKGLLDMTSGLKKIVTIVEDLAKDSIEDGEKVDGKIDELLYKISHLYRLKLGAVLVSSLGEFSMHLSTLCGDSFHHSFVFSRQEFQKRLLSTEWECLTE